MLELLLDPENARIRSGSDQADCIEKILRKEAQLMELLKDIAEDGLSTVPILVSKNDEQKWVVRDGNRRVTALKLLNNPELSPDERLRAQIRAIAEKYQESIPKTIDCLATGDESAMLKELLVRHQGELSGVGQMTWSAYLRVAFLLRHGQADQNKRAAQYLRWAELQGLPVDDDFPLTTLTRLLNVEALKGLGFTVSDDDLVPALPVDKIRRMANRIIVDLQSGNVKVNDIFTVDQQKGYLTRVRGEAGVDEGGARQGQPAGGTGQRGQQGDSAGPGVSSPGSGAPAGAAGEGMGQGAGKGDGGTNGTARPGSTGGSNGTRPNSPRKPSWDRARLFPQNRPGIAVPQDQIKVRNIISELQTLKVTETPIAVAVLFRSLLDISEAQYRDRHGLPRKDAFHKNVASVADHMKQRGILSDDRYAVIISRTRDESGILNVKTLHGYVHSDSFHPEKQTLNSLWDEIGHFVVHCWYESDRA
ncbi:ParB-like nuclease family protein [Cupriavidus plantarum]|nr:ParB-like nuclease family protein [Cupriavidus plantarum]